MKRVFVVVGVVGLLALLGCDTKPPPTAVGDPCSADDKCDKGFVCLDVGDDEDTCVTLPDGCEAIDGCDCAAVDALCPEESIGNVCVTFSTKINLTCELGEGGEGEGEAP